MRPPKRTKPQRSRTRWHSCWRNFRHRVRTARRLLAPKAAVDAGDTGHGENQLEWVVANSNEDELKSLARLRLAAVLIDQKQFDAALAALEGKHSESFAGLFLDMKGDIFNLQGKAADIKPRMKRHSPSLTPKGRKGSTQLKLDALASGTTSAPIPASHRRQPQQLLPQRRQRPPEPKK